MAIKIPMYRMHSIYARVKRSRRKNILMNIENRVIPRPEHPRPQFYRESWKNLNGYWDFDFDLCDSKKVQRWAEQEEYPHKILVPFCPESKLSGIEYTDYMEAVWYKRTVSMTKEELQGRVLLHFGAVDYECEVFMNGTSVGKHVGGYTSFTFDVTEALKEGENTLVVYAADHIRSNLQPSGKQSKEWASEGCYYTRTTGIWQTVWLEFVPAIYMTSMEAIPDPDNGCVDLKVFTNQPAHGLKLTAKAFLEGEKVADVTVHCGGNYTLLTVPVSVKKLWTPEMPNLYDLKLSLESDCETVDIVDSYFGLRSVTLAKKVMLLNNKNYYQRLVLDQGFYPDGIYTAPSDDELKRDIILGKEMGFNGARMHEKVFEERYMYWADKLGYILWGEYPNWGLNTSEADALCTYLPEWIESVKRDFNHPSIIGWCPFNETKDFLGKQQDDRVISGIYWATKAIDPTRPVIDTSGYFHVVTDIYDVHEYEQDVKVWEEVYGNGQLYDHKIRQNHNEEPFFVSEYGGTWWNSEAAAELRAEMERGNERSVSWGYGKRPMTEMEAGTRIAQLTKTLLKNPNIFAFCYTQLTDVEQEQNGLYYYDRTPKFSEEVYKIIKEGFEYPAAIEEE